MRGRPRLHASSLPSSSGVVKKRKPGRKPKLTKFITKQFEKSPTIEKNVEVEEEQDDVDLTRDLENPLPFLNFHQIKIPDNLPRMLFGRESEYQPSKQGTLIDLDEDDHDVLDEETVQTDEEINVVHEVSNDLQDSSHMDKKEEDENNASGKTYHTILPSLSSWFDYSTVHAVEKSAIPTFFDKSSKRKTAEVYLAVRNFIVDSYRTNPFHYLTIADCARALPADLCSVASVHTFLQLWGLINYHIGPECDTLQLPTDHFFILSDSADGDLEPVKPTVSSQAPSDQMISFTDVADEAPDEETENSFNLNSCSASKPKQGPYIEWTDDETLRLLEAIELYQDDWNNVREHVSTRTVDECILHFLQIPAEDSYLDNLKHLSAEASDVTPFAEAKNPVMSTLAFLASVVDPKVAAMGSKAAMDELLRLQSENRKAGKLGDKAGFKKEPNATGSPVPMVTQEESPVLQVKEELNGESVGSEEILGPSIKTSEKSLNDGDKVQIKQEELKTAPLKTEKKKPACGKVDKSQKKDKDKDGISEHDTHCAVQAALAAAGEKAKNLAATEERKIKSLIAHLVETEMKKLEIKLRHFEELETIMEQERDSLESQRLAILQDRQHFNIECLKKQQGQMEIDETAGSASSSSSSMSDMEMNKEDIVSAESSPFEQDIVVIEGNDRSGNASHDSDSSDDY